MKDIISTDWVRDPVSRHLVTARLKRELCLVFRRGFFRNSQEIDYGIW